ncbi:MAG: NAD(P)H-dependent oxidoreductase [Sideroxyarcus sp.]|nr:NAD(P)H-dependent oxidoreductase [Sideroxyarcus sp.]
MKCLVVIAHPLQESLCNSLAAQAIETLRAAGHEVLIEDLYRNNFAAAMTDAERSSCYTQCYDAGAIQPEADRLLAADALVLCFPTWWFGFPAILKGWFDRVWGPGIAYDHATDLGPVKPRLHKLRRVLVVTTLGSPWWVDWLVLHRPVRRVLKRAILGTCAPNCRFEMLSLYKSERLDDAQVRRFSAKVNKALSKWA